MGIAGFLGIPFAKPPVGALRWQPPEPFGAWQSPRDATKSGDACIQHGAPKYGLSEDCLTLDIFTPVAQLTSDEKFAVMLWIYGGADTSGATQDYPLDALVAGSDNQVLVAAMNYRLSVFGFAASEEIQARTSDGSAGNFGLQDQRLAMVWVRDNIGAFGGDSGRVTIFGESAGAYNVMAHLALPASVGLFQRAIMESATYNAGAQPFSDAEKDYAKMKKRVGCQDLDCLLNHKNATELLPNGLKILYYPVVDGVALEHSADVSIRQGHYQSNVDVLLGSNRDEMGFFISPILSASLHRQNLTKIELDLLQHFFIGHGSKDNLFTVKEAKKLYDPSVYDYPADLGSHNQEWWTLVRMATDGFGMGDFVKEETGVFGLGTCGARHLARDLKAGGTANVFQYLFDKQYPFNLPGLDDIIPGSKDFVGHAFEIPYVFGYESVIQDDSQKKLSGAMAKYWSSFASTGRPHGEGLPEWPQYDTDTDTLMRLADDIHTESNLRSAQCDFWEKHPVHFDPAILSNAVDWCAQTKICPSGDDATLVVV